MDSPSLDAPAGSLAWGSPFGSDISGILMGAAGVADSSPLGEPPWPLVEREPETAVAVSTDTVGEF